MGLVEFISVLAIYLEIAVLAFFEYKMWRTMYTPLNLLMLPYAVMLLVTILASGTMDIVDFYYPSMLLWMLGLLLFAIPSFMLAIPLRNRLKKEHTGFILDNINMKYLNIFSVLLVSAFLLRFVFMVKTSSLLPGSDDFGYEYCGKGFWGHLHRALHALSIIYIYKFDKKHKWYLFLIGGMFFVTLMYGVKSWVLIPAIGGICMRLYTGKLKLSPSLILKVFILAFAVFVVTYTFSLVLGVSESVAFIGVFEFVCKNFVHYVISGVMGWSQDLELGILEKSNFDILIAHVMNIYNVVVGNEYVQSINPYFIHNGVNGSNVRSFFGTIYINSNVLQYIIFVLSVSIIVYSLKLWALFSKSIYINIVYFFIGGMLIMGWFDYFFYNLAALEVPGWVFILYMMFKCSPNEEVKSIKTSKEQLL